MDAVDTNILIYAHDPRDPRKQKIAAALIPSIQDGALLWQVACEYIANSRKLASWGVNLANACQNIRDLQRVWTTVLPDWGMLAETERLLGAHSLQVWDAFLIAACRSAGITKLYSEDFGDPPKGIAGVTIINPFR
jgi:predicted nucleic acid-binding protein